MWNVLSYNGNMWIKYHDIYNFKLHIWSILLTPNYHVLELNFLITRRKLPILIRYFFVSMNSESEHKTTKLNSIIRNVHLSVSLLSMWRLRLDRFHCIVTHYMHYTTLQCITLQILTIRSSHLTSHSSPLSLHWRRSWHRWISLKRETRIQSPV